MSTLPGTADRNLLFGLLALQNRLVGRDALLDAMQAWLGRKHDPLAVVLQERGALTAKRVKLLDDLVDEHVSEHGGDSQRSLGSLVAEAPVLQALSELIDADLQASVSALAQEVPSETPPLPLPPAGSIGWSRYRKLRFHAKGGLGEVWVARDAELGREVALKEIQSQHADQEQYRARFVREAEITGKLEHPSIVPVYGLGRYPDGRPYYAMRLIKGESLRDAIRRFHEDDEVRRDPGERELALRRLLVRFVAVCNAVGYAHSCGVVHRDLKPANVMLGEYGETLVVDWGLAKRVDQPEDATAVERQVVLTESDPAATGLGQAIGTPAYMAPEQARGEHDTVDARTDVWALGATLYCLLTGKAPYPGPDIPAQAAKGEVAPARRVNARVPAALEAVCARAMAARPEDRYKSARRLAADVERFLADEPVTARREPARERLRRWGKRNRAVVASGVVLLLLSVVGLAGGLNAVRAEQRKTAAHLDRAEKAEAVASQRLVQAEENLKQAGENFELARQVIDEFLAFATGHALFNRSDLSTEIGQVRLHLLKRCLPWFQKLLARRHGKGMEDADVFRLHFRAGMILDQLTRKEEAVASYRQAEQVARRMAEAKPGKAGPQALLATTLSNLGGALHALNRHDEALASYEEALRLRRQLIEAQADELKHRSALARTLHGLGHAQRELGRAPKARQTYGQAARLRRALAEDPHHTAEHLNDLAATLTELAILQPPQGWENAMLHYEEAASLRRRLAKANPDNPAYRLDLCRPLLNQGALLRRGRPEEARRALDEAVTVLAGLKRSHPGHPDVDRFRFLAYRERAHALNAAGRCPSAPAARAALLHRAALADWDLALALAPADERLAIRLERTFGLVYAGEPNRAAAEAADLARGTDLEPGVVYDLACALALCAGARQDRQPLSDHERTAEGRARDAVALLRRVAKAGFFRNPVNFDHLHEDTDLDSLRDRPDFRAFLASLPPPVK